MIQGGAGIDSDGQESAPPEASGSAVVVAAEDLLGEAGKLAVRIAAGPPVATRLAKRMLQRGLEMDLDTAMQMSAAAETITLSSRDHLEGLAAMREKRRPQFRGA